MLEASCADEAMSLAGIHEGAIDLLLTDSVMPGGSGPELGDRLTGVRQNTRVLFMSGYTDHAALRQGLLRERAAFLQKPFTPRSLLHAVRDTLDLRAARPAA